MAAEFWSRPDMLDSFERLFDAVRARVDLLNETVTVWVEADDVLASAGPDGALLRWDASLGGTPIFEATFDEIDSGYRDLCEPSPGAGCRAARHGYGCPLQPPCDPMAGFRRQLDDSLPADTELGALSLTLTHIKARWLPPEFPTSPPS